MKTRLIHILIFVSLVVFASGCQDKCQGVVCFNGQECFDGHCKCAHGPEEGYTEDCQKIPSDQKPTITTLGAGNITQTSAAIGGNISSVGGSPVTVRGICWSATNTSPTTQDNKTENGQGLGTFTVTLTGLTPGAHYFARAYATNTAGTSYGNTVTLNIPAGAGPTLTDIDGNQYATLYLNGKLWMAENLKVTKYRNGDAIPTGLTNTWASTQSGAYGSYGGTQTYVPQLGYLYNRYAVNDPRGLAPTGWHIPTRDEWHELILSLGGYAAAGGSMKITGGGGWNLPNTGATNNSGFSARGGGLRSDSPTPTYSSKGVIGYWWASDLDPNNSPYYLILKATTAQAAIEQFYSPNNGFSVRCVKD